MSDLEKSRFNGNSPAGAAAFAGLFDKRGIISKVEKRIRINAENVWLRFI